MDKLYKRSFLNSKTGVAACTIMLEKVKETEFNGTVEIADCNRVVRLDMDFWTPVMKKEKIKKIKLLIEMLILMLNHMEEAEIKKY